MRVVIIDGEKEPEPEHVIYCTNYKEIQIINYFTTLQVSYLVEEKISQFAIQWFEQF